MRHYITNQTAVRTLKAELEETLQCPAQSIDANQSWDGGCTCRVV